MAAKRWVLLSYRLPREPSTPRITLWRALRGLGVAQLGDGLVALPADARTREQLEWLAEEVEQAGGEAAIWLAEPGSARQERALEARMQAEIAEQYRQLIEAAEKALHMDPGARKRSLGRLRRELRKINRRDYFPPPERKAAQEAVAKLAASLEEVTA